MSSVRVAVLPGGTVAPAVARAGSQPRRERLALQAAAFAALGLYGVARWDTLLAGGLGRLMGLLALSTLLALAGPVLARWSRWLAGLAFLVGALAALAISGLPLEWLLHARVAVSGRAIGNGLSALPQISVPYVGVNQWVQVTILLGAAILLLDAALVLTFVPRRLGQLRLGGAALPLVALSVIPATALRPRSAYGEGVLLFLLIALFMWGERIDGQRLSGVLAPCALAAALAIGLAPTLDRHHSWINYRQLAASLAPGGVESFNWTQGYGPLTWPHSGRAVLEIQARRPEYWKAENLDVFDGVGWVAGRAAAPLPWQMGISASSLRRWTQTIQVTVDSMATNKVIAAGSAYPPTDLPGGAVGGLSPGTWQSSRRLRPGASYRVTVYAPEPSAARLQSAGTAYPLALARGYLALAVPQGSGPGRSGSSSPGAQIPTGIVMPPFTRSGPARVDSTSQLATVLSSSPYAGAFALARRLEAGARTPYEYVHRVQRYLAHGYRYSQTPPTSQYPLESFLFVHRVGYCQHFAGAMALLLRLGGVPARVSVGFTAGNFDSATRRWVVSDLGAHAWVEAWFPGYGWVRFDPTPGADPALSDSSAIATPGPGSAGRAVVVPRHRDLGPPPRPVNRRGGHRAAGGSVAAGLFAAPLLALAVILLLLLTRARGGVDRVGELIQAYARTGRPLEPATTLSGLEARLAHSPEAAEYVRSVRLSRFAPGPPPAMAQDLSLRGRRALRRALASSLGPVGHLRAWWALPPRWHWPGDG